MELRIVEGTVVTSTTVPYTDTERAMTTPVPAGAGVIPVQHTAYGIVIGDPAGTCAILRQDEWNQVLLTMAIRPVRG